MIFLKRSCKTTIYLPHLSSLSLYHSDTLESPNSFLLCRADHFLTTSVIELKKKKKDVKALPCKGPAVKNFCVCWNVCGSSWQSYLSSNYKHNTTTSQVIYKHIWRKSLFSFFDFHFHLPIYSFHSLFTSRPKTCTKTELGTQRNHC